MPLKFVIGGSVFASIFCADVSESTGDVVLIGREVDTNVLW